MWSDEADRFIHFIFISGTTFTPNGIGYDESGSEVVPFEGGLLCRTKLVPDDDDDYEGDCCVCRGSSGTSGTSSP